MSSHDFVSLYDARALEYVIAVAYLALFVVLWRALQAAPQRQRARVLAGPARWFSLPDGVRLHPGHAWARVEADGRVAVGLDDFAHKLIGPLTQVALPDKGARLGQGRRALSLRADGGAVDVLAPVSGVVAEVNPLAASAPDRLHEDPYGQGWLLKLQPRQGLETNLKQLLSGDLARLAMERAAEDLRARLTPELGALAADGGTPVHGFARELDPEGWEALAREFLLTDDVPEGR
jgi:glycine cleavage system H lipoate-binding protein